MTIPHSVHQLSKLLIHFKFEACIPTDLGRDNVGYSYFPLVFTILLQTMSINRILDCALLFTTGSSHTDVKCAPCPEGFYSAESSCTGGCQKLTVCPSNCTTIPGNDKHDVYCSLCKSGTKTREGETLIKALSDGLAEFFLFV